MNSKGYIELHGSKLILNTGDNIIPIQGSFIVGDKVSLSSKLIYRIPQAIIAIVKSDFTLYFPDINHLKFSPVIELNSVSVCVGDKIILWLTSCGKIIINKVFSGNEESNEECLLYMYSLTEKRKHIEYYSGENYYTIKNTVNHNDLDTFTIDPELSIDFDDAISVDIDNKIIYIHIVDITILPSSQTQKLIDKCFSLYLTNNTVHLLDSVNELSLIKNKERKVITVKVHFDNEYKIKKYDIYKSTIIVKNRYNYKQILEEKLQQPNIAFLLNLANINSSSFFKYNINIHSIKIINDKIVNENSNDISHNLVATVMIICNTIVSKHLSDNKVIIPNRFHSKIIGIDIPDNFKLTDNDTLNSYIIIKKFSKAIYSTEEKGHFGLNVLDYVHFTSPMRRYADVIIHRILSGYQYEYNALNEEIKYINHRNLKVKSIQKLHEKWSLSKYLQLNLHKEIYNVYITGINSSGILWFMPSLCINGFIHISKLYPKQYWKFENSKLIGKDNEFNLYDKLNVNIENINIITLDITVKQSFQL